MTSSSPPSISLFRAATDTESYAAGETVFRQGDAGDAMFVVKEGSLDIVIGGRVVETLGPGGIAGEMAIVDKQPRSASAVAQTACQLVRITPERFKFLISQTPFFAIEVMQVMAHRLRSANSRL
jgi:CRP/FNR family transcriptional regulator, cyclic AMP receptor protein